MIVNANALQIPLPDKSVHMCVTSPPYWGLRDYGTAKWVGGDEGCDHVERTLKPSAKSTLQDHGDDGRSPYLDNLKGIPYRDTCPKCGAARVDDQLGLEPTPEQFIANMVAVFREVWRVLRDDGTCWVNLGDSYAGGGRGGNSDAITGRGKNESQVSHCVPGGLKTKDLCGIPWRVALALQADGWYLRSDIIWAKSNPMPESVTDRPTKAHEYLFLLSKRPRYFYDADAVRENNVTVGDKREGNGRHTYFGKCDGTTGTQQAAVTINPAGRNRRTVWTIATAPYSGAHFATFPPKLVEPCIKAGTSEHGVCPVCGSQWKRVVERTGHINKREPAHVPGNTPTKVDSTGWAPVTMATNEWQATCDHNADPIPATVLDPFCGSATTGIVARRLGRRFIGLDLSWDYLNEQARKRLEMDKLSEWENGRTDEANWHDLPMFDQRSG